MDLESKVFLRSFGSPMQVYFFFICLLLAHSVYSGVYSDIPHEDSPIIYQPGSSQLKVLHANNHQKITELSTVISEFRNNSEEAREESIKRILSDNSCFGKCLVSGLVLGESLVAGGLMADVGVGVNYIVEPCCNSCLCYQPTCAQCAVGCFGTYFVFCCLGMNLWVWKEIFKEHSIKSKKCHSSEKLTINHSDFNQAYECMVCLEEKEEIGLHRCSPDQDLVVASGICKPCLEGMEKLMGKKQCLICTKKVNFPQG